MRAKQTVGLLVRGLLVAAAAMMSAQQPPAPAEPRVNAKDFLKYAWIPPGSFRMGCSPTDRLCANDELPAHTVEISHGFWIGATPVTAAAWKRYHAAGGKSALPDTDLMGRKLNEASPDDSVPVVSVTWNEASDYCHWAGMRLPTEAEWEYAARAGSTAAVYGYLDVVAWYADNSGRKPADGADLFRQDQAKYQKRLFANGNGPHPVGQKTPNAWGLYDTLGNVWQWVSDYYATDYYAANVGKDPTGPAQGTQKVLRGGAWDTLQNNVRVSYRLTNPPGDRVNNFGFRCAGNLP